MLPPEQFVLKRMDMTVPLHHQVKNAHVLIPTTGKPPTTRFISEMWEKKILQKHFTSM